MNYSTHSGRAEVPAESPEPTRPYLISSVKMRNKRSVSTDTSRYIRDCRFRTCHRRSTRFPPFPSRQRHRYSSPCTPLTWCRVSRYRTRLFLQCNSAGFPRSSFREFLRTSDKNNAFN